MLNLSSIMISLIKLKDIHQREDTDHVHAIVRTGPRATHMIHVGDLAPAGTMLVTPVLEELFQHLNILCLPKLYTLSVDKFMHSYHNKLLPNHFGDYFIPISSIHSYSTRRATSNNLFLPRVNSSSGKYSYLCWPKSVNFNTRRY